MVRREFQMQLRLAGGLGVRYGYDRFLRRMIADNNLSGSVNIWRLDGASMAKSCPVPCFAIASYIENSPNSLARHAGGMPCVALMWENSQPVDPGRTGLLFPGWMRRFSPIRSVDFSR